MTVVFFVLGLVVLVVGANLLVRGASKLALSFGISPLVVGLTIVAFGTSAPEMAVSVQSALSGSADLAVGNVIGSNIFNILFILGISAVITPLVVNAQIIKQEIPVMLATSLLFAIFAIDLKLSVMESTVLFSCLAGYVFYLVQQSRKETKATEKEYKEEFTTTSTWDKHWAVQIGLIVAGLFALVQGSSWLIESCVTIAKYFGVSDLVIGLTIMAAGTSMPEVATSITAAIKGEKDIAVGNVIGSNTFNILGCLGLSGIVVPGGSIAVSSSILGFDVWVMLASSFVCLPFMLPRKELSRFTGFLFLAFYVAYVVYLVFSSSAHSLTGAFSSVFIEFVLPATIIGVLVIFLRYASNTKTIE